VPESGSEALVAPWRFVPSFLPRKPLAAQIAAQCFFA
jgi:hypothetical protein